MTDLERGLYIAGNKFYQAMQEHQGQVPLSKLYALQIEFSRVLGKADFVSQEGYVCMVCATERVADARCLCDGCAVKVLEWEEAEYA